MNKVVYFKWRTAGRLPLLPLLLSLLTLMFAGSLRAQPLIQTQPQNQIVINGSNVVFSVGATGGDLSYQWYFNDTNFIVGATNAMLSIAGVQMAQAGNYSVIVSNSLGAVTTADAGLTVLGVPVNPYLPGTLGYDLFQGVYALASVTNKTAQYNPNIPNLGTNTAVWTWPVNLSCLGYALPGDQYQAVLIAPDKILAGGYYCGHCGDTVNFRDTNGIPWSAQVTNVVWIIGDMVIAQLNDTAPPSIVMPYVLPPDYTNYIAGHSLVGMPAFWAHKNPAHLDYANITIVGDYNWYGYGTWMDLLHSSQSYSGSTATGGDADDPAFLVWSNNPVLLFGTELAGDAAGMFVSGATNWSALAALGLTNNLKILDIAGAGYPLQPAVNPMTNFGYDYILPLTNQITTNIGGVLTLNAGVFLLGGDSSLSYQWQLNGVNLPGATNAQLVIEALPGYAGIYTVVVSGPLGVVTNGSARLTVPWSRYAVPGAALTNFVFQSDETYLISSTVQLYGTTTIEGGTVIKYAHQPPSDAYNGTPVQMFVNGPLVTDTASYRPAVLTSQDDDSVGDTIGSSTGQPLTLSGVTYLTFNTSPANACQYLRIKYAGTGLSVPAGVDFWHCQFVQCATAVSNSGTGAIGLHNVLLAQCGNAVATAGNVVAEQVTADQCQSFLAARQGNAYVTNSLFTAVANQTGVFASSSVSLPGGSAVYQPAGGGGYYLAANTYQNQGTTNISPLLLAQLRARTTQAPLTCSNVLVTTNLTLTPWVRRDTNASVDLGYHYDPLDYLCAEVYVTNATLTVTPGTAIGCFGLSWDYSYYSLGFDGGAQFISQGLATDLIHLAEYSEVQESYPDTNWVLGGFEYQNAMLIDEVNLGSTGEVLNCRFTDLSCLSDDADIFSLWAPSSWIMRDCQTHGGDIYGYNQVQNLTNCLFERVGITMYDEYYPTSSIASRNCLVSGGNFDFYAFGQGDTNSVFLDNSFDHTFAYLRHGPNVGHNAYVVSTNSYGYAPSDLILTNSLAYQAGPLGNYYQPTNSPLIDMGSTTADQVGLYHYTAQISEIPETNSIVDIGYHYVAIGQNGNPLDTNGDGIPDYIEDANGNGIYDAGDTGNWQ